MKFCLSSRLSPIYLKKADQIKVEHRDIKALSQLFEDYPEAEIVFSVTHPLDAEEISYLKKMNILARNKLILAFPFYPTGDMREGLRFYTSYPVESYSEANALIAAGSEAICVGCPLFFQKDKLKALKTQIRLVINEPWLSLVPRDNGICGQWIRPEDLHLYEDIGDVIAEFNNCRISEEEALYRVYSEGQNWPGPLSFLIHNLGDEALNRLLDKGLGEARLNCGHKCQDPQGHCSICPNAFKLAHIVEAKYAVEKN